MVILNEHLDKFFLVMLDVIGSAPDTSLNAYLAPGDDLHWRDLFESSAKAFIYEPHGILGDEEERTKAAVCLTSASYLRESLEKVLQ